MRPWLRRLITRMLAMVPAAFTICYRGRAGRRYQLLVLSQVILSMQLPFAVIPLIHFTSDREHGWEPFANRAWVRMLAWLTAVIIIGAECAAGGDGDRGLAGGGGRVEDGWSGSPWFRSRGGFALLLLWVTMEPRMSRCDAQYGRRAGGTARARGRRNRRPGLSPDPGAAGPYGVGPPGGEPRGRHGETLRSAIYLLHVEEGVTSQVYGQESSTAEVELGEQYLERIAQSLRDQGVSVETAISHSSSPNEGNSCVMPRKSTPTW